MVQSAGVQTMSQDSAVHSGAVFKYSKAVLLSNYEWVGQEMDHGWIQKNIKTLSSNPEPERDAQAGPALFESWVNFDDFIM